MNADDLQELYKLLRGSRSAMIVLDARAQFADRQWEKALALLQEARDTYAESRTRLLRQDPEDVRGKDQDAQRQTRRIKRKQDKVREILDTFDELLPQLEKLAKRQQQRDEKQVTAPTLAAEESSAPVADADQEPQQPPDVDDFSVARPADVTDEFATAFLQSTGDDQLGLISRYFGFREVSSDRDIHADALYFIRSGEKSFLVRTLGNATSDTEVTLASAIDETPMKPFQPKAFIKLGKKRKMVLLTTRSPREDQDESPDDDSAAGTESPDQPSDQNVLDMGAFSQLLTSAQRSGIVPGADQIAHVRDREFKKGDYDLAFQTIEALYAKFNASMNQRTQRLTREDAEIASGRIKMSPKDLQAKRSRDRTQTQEIERARRRFQVVLEGLRILMNTT